MKCRLNRYLPLILALGPIALSVTLFVFGVLLLQLGDAFSTSEKTSSQQVILGTGDVLLAFTYFLWTLVPLFVISGIIVFIVRKVRSKKL